MPSFKEGDPLPYLQIDVTSPVMQTGSYLSHTIYDAATNKVVATYPLKNEGTGASSGQMVYQQVGLAKGTKESV